MAESLGLLDEEGDEDHLALLQMPSLLPAPRPEHDAADSRRGHPKHVRQREAQAAAATLTDLPCGKASSTSVLAVWQVTLRLGRTAQVA